MKLEENVNRIKDMMGLHESKFLLRRIDKEVLDKALEDSLNYTEGIYYRNKDRWGSMTLEKFKQITTTVMMDDIHPVLSDWGSKNFPYDEVYDFIHDTYSEKIKRRYNQIFKS